VTRSEMAGYGKIAAMSTTTPRPAKRTLRPPAVVRELILTAARSCFAESGYTGTSTRAIATRAGVVENLIYRHFGSKTALFDQAVIQPFRAAVDEFLGRWTPTSASPHSLDVTARAFIESMYDLVEDQAELVLALMSPRADERESPLLPMLEELERVGAYELGLNGYQGVDLQVIIRCEFGMVLFNAAFSSALYRPDSRPSRERIVDEMTALLVHGSAHRPV
jgi:AcrR family transcriptional regulator